MAEGSLAGTETLRKEELPADLRGRFPRGSVVEHAPIPFPNFPYEWPPEMLHWAVALTLQLARAAVDTGFTLKAATPYNLMFDGTQPVFLDLSSFHRRDLLDPMWPPYAQFTRPLLAFRFFGLRPDEIFLLTGARRLLEMRRPGPHCRVALDYRNGAGSCTPEQFGDKRRLVFTTFERWPPRKLLDIGSNTGHFSLIAARHGAHVVAVDRDPVALGTLWRTARQAKANVLTLLVDIARPPGACGPANSECDSFLARACGQLDYVLLLAILHHLLVNERALLPEIFALAAQLTTQFAVMEYVDPADPQLHRVARGRDSLHRALSHESFECAAGGFFRSWRLRT
jgi:hypothetical protein